MKFEVDISDPAAEDLERILIKTSVDVICFVENFISEKLAADPISNSEPIRHPYIAAGSRMKELLYQDEKIYCNVILFFDILPNNLLFIRNFGFAVYHVGRAD